MHKNSVKLFRFLKNFTFPNNNKYIPSQFLDSNLRSFRFSSTGQIKKLNVLTSVMEMQKPQGVLHNWDLRAYLPSDIQVKCEELKTTTKNLYDQVAAAEELTYKNVFEPILTAEKLLYGWWFANSGALLTFPRHVATSVELRDASVSVTKELGQAMLEMDMRKDVFEKLVAYREGSAEKENLSAEKMRNLNRIIKTGRRNGLHLEQDMRDKISAIKKEAASLRLDFGKNLADINVSLLWTKEELEGVPSNFFESLETDDATGKYKVTLKYPHYLPIMRKCTVPETRRKMEKEFNSRGGIENKKILERLIQLRQEEATCLGYKSHSAYVLELNMAETPETVTKFLHDLAEKLQPLWKAEREVMLKMKKEECENTGREYDGKLNMWDMGYYLNRVEEELYSLESEVIRGYFPEEVVTKGLLEIYEDLLGLSFTKVENAQRWHDEVSMYQMNDRATGKLMGYFFLDLFPREGKYGHACCTPIQAGYVNESGERDVSVGVMICNFTRPTSTTPALLDKDEVETYFHEFGHMMHNLCANVETTKFFGTAVQRDFVEAPSQMLENWVWEKEPLTRMSSHYKTKEPLPDDLIEKLKKARNANAGYTNLRQIVFGLFDQKIHSGGECDVGEVYAETLKEVMGLETSPGTCFPSNFEHVAGEYSARYYGYLWSEVFSMDMFTVFKEQGIMSPEAGMKYRKCILEKGGTQDAIDLLKDFLGREPNQDAFLESKGLSVVGSKQAFKCPA